MKMTYMITALVLVIVHLVRAEKPWSFAVVSDIHVNSNVMHCLNDSILHEKHKPSFLLFCGDFVNGGSEATINTELELWWTLMGAILVRNGIGIYAVPGNHDMHIAEGYYSDRAWKKFWTSKSLRESAEKSFVFYTNGCAFIGLDNFTSTVHPYQVGARWLQSKLTNQNIRIAFAFGHTALFPFSGRSAHEDTLGMYPECRNAITGIFFSNVVRYYFAGHDHWYDHAVVKNGASNMLEQFIIGTGGGRLRAWQGTYAEGNVTNIYHAKVYGYLFVTVDFETITFEMKSLRINGLKRFFLGRTRTIERCIVRK